MCHTHVITNHEYDNVHSDSNSTLTPHENKISSKGNGQSYTRDTHTGQCFCVTNSDTINISHEVQILVQTLGEPGNNVKKNSTRFYFKHSMEPFASIPVS